MAQDSIDRVVPLESCRCDEYKEVVDKFHFFLPGTLHHMIPRLDAPEGYCFKWVKNKTSIDEPQFFRAKLVRIVTSSGDDDQDDRSGKKCRECKAKAADYVEKCIPPKLRVIDGVIQEDESPIPNPEVQEVVQEEKQAISSKWIPVLPGLISQKYWLNQINHDLCSQDRLFAISQIVRLIWKKSRTRS